MTIFSFKLWYSGRLLLIILRAKINELNLSIRHEQIFLDKSGESCPSNLLSNIIDSIGAFSQNPTLNDLRILGGSRALNPSLLSALRGYKPGLFSGCIGYCRPGKVEEDTFYISDSKKIKCKL